VQGLLGTKRMEFLLDALDQAYDFVILNAAPMTEHSAQEIAAKAGSALICAQGTRSGKRAGSVAMQTLMTHSVHRILAVTVQSDNVFSRLLSKYRSAA